jgi:MerR family copper efflux transcriptional regulator
MQIGGVAKKAGLTPDAIRFYERSALLPRAPRTPGGFRQYEDTDLETLGFIRQTQGLGFTLNEVRELLELRHRKLQPCAPVRFRLSQKLADVHKKQAGLQELERELRAALLACDRKLSSRSKRCPLLSGKGSRKSRSEN